MPEETGSFYICPVCFWEDDDLQLSWVNLAVGANSVSLIDAQKTFAAIGAMDERFLKQVREPKSNEPIDPKWRPADPDLDKAFFATWDQIEAESNLGSDGQIASRAVDRRVNRYWIGKDQDRS
jgi:hypothetical protein